MRKNTKLFYSTYLIFNNSKNDIRPVLIDWLTPYTFDCQNKKKVVKLLVS